MDGLRVGLLVVLTGTLLLDSVWGWNGVNSRKQLNLNGTVPWDEPQRAPSDDYNYNDVDDDNKIPEDAIPERKGEATSDGDLRSFAHFRLPVKGEDSGPGNWASGTNDGFQVKFARAPPRAWTDRSSLRSAWLDVVCSNTNFRITLVTGQLNNLNVIGSDHLLLVMNAPESCGYRVNPLTNTVTVPFTGCNVKYVTEVDEYTVQLLYFYENGQTKVATASCEGGLGGVLNSNLFPQPLVQPQRAPPCGTSTNAPASAPASIPASPKAQNCAVSSRERLRCGQPGISSFNCEMMGCCVDSFTFACYYPLDECTADYQFIFAIRYNSISVPVDPTNLVIPGSNCKPVIADDKVAIFKFKVTECGVRVYDIGYTKIYLVEVRTLIKTLDLKFGVITRTDPVRFTVECRYNQKGTDQQLLASTGYMVKTPSSIMPSTLIGNGLYGVDLRIATNKTYSSYLPNVHPPLRLLLGSPVYLELNLMSPVPEAVILVNYCVAYPLSAKNALVLIYEGCANPNDPNVAILKVSDLPQNRHQRRFVVTAFQFMDQKTNRYLDEEIYFMCSTEVCRPTEKTCKDQCFGG